MQLVIFLSVGMINLRENKLHLDFQIGSPKYLPRVREVSFPLLPFLCQNCSLSWGIAFLWGTGTFPQTWLPGSDLFPWGLFFPWPSFFPNHFIFLVPVYSWVYKAVGIVDRKGTWPNTYLDGWCFQSERLAHRGRTLCPGPTVHQLAVQLTVSEDKDLLVCISKIFRTLPRESSFFFLRLFGRNQK